MKKIFIMLLLCSAAIGLSAQGQGCVPIVREGVQWVYGLQYISVGTSQLSRTTMTIEFRGDTIIEGVKYKKCYRTYGTNDKAKCTDKNDVYDITTEPVPIAYCREEIDDQFQRTYAIFSEAFRREMYFIGHGIHTYEADHMFDDPNMVSLVNAYLTPSGIEALSNKPASPLSLFYDDVLLTRKQREKDFNFTYKSSVEINGKTRQILSSVDYDNYTRGHYSVWVEGIGLYLEDWMKKSTHGGIFISPFAHFRTLDATTFLNHVVENGEIVYKALEYDDSFNVISSVGDVKVPQIETADDSYYNLMGQPVAHPEDAPGIYIHEGKKVRF